MTSYLATVPLLVLQNSRSSTRCINNWTQGILRHSASLNAFEIGSSLPQYDRSTSIVKLNKHLKFFGNADVEVGNSRSFSS